MTLPCLLQISIKAILSMIIIVSCIEKCVCEFDPFADSVPYTIKWSGPVEAAADSLVSYPSH